MKILTVSKDLGPARVAVAASLALAGHEHEVIGIVEGLAAKPFRDAFLPIYFQGSENFRAEPFTLDPVASLAKIKPDLVLVTSSSPINLERSFAETAAAANIPVVVLEDFWGVHCRIGNFLPNLVLTLDNYGQTLVEATYGGRVPTVLVGNSGIAQVNQNNDPKLEEWFAEQRRKYGLVLVYAGGEPKYTTEELSLLVECLKQTKTPCCLIPRYHPKFAKQASNLPNCTWGEVWDAFLDTSGVKILRPEAGSSDPLVKLADVTLSGFSTLLTTAALAGKRAIALSTQASRDSLFVQARLPVAPQVALCLAQGVSKVQDLTPLFGAAIKCPELEPYDAAKAAAAIIKLVS